MTTRPSNSLSIELGEMGWRSLVRVLLLVVSLSLGLVLTIIGAEKALACDVSSCTTEDPPEPPPPEPPEPPPCDGCSSPDNDKPSDRDECEDTPASGGSSGSGSGGGSCCKNSSGKPVSAYTGGELYTAVDMVVNGVMPIRMIRKYDSQSRYDSPVGYGWGLTLDKRLYKYADNTIVVRNDCGTRNTWVYSGGAYQSPTGLRETLVEDANGFTLTKLRGEREVYDLKGRLTAIISPQGNRLEMTYDPAGRIPLKGSSPFSITPNQPAMVSYDYRLTKIEEKLADGTVTGNQVSLVYDNATGRLAEMTAGDGRKVTYIHDTTASAKNGNLLTVTGLEGMVYTYVYNDLAQDGITLQDAHNVTSFQMGSGTTPYINKYDSLDRVTQQTHGFNTLAFAYQQPGIKTLVTKTIRSADGSTAINTLTTSFEFDTGGYAKEKIITLPDTTQYRYNYVRNSDARIKKETVFEKPPGGSEVTVRTIDYGYDAGNNVASVSTQLAAGEIVTTSRTFDHQWLGSLQTVSTARPGEVFRTEYTFYYDAVTGYPTNIKEMKRIKANGEPLTTTYAYDDNGQLILTTLPDGHQIRNVYAGDKLDHRRHEIDGQVSLYLQQAFGYDDQDNVNHLTNARDYSGNVVSDDLGRVTKVTNAKSEEIEFIYDPLYLSGTVLRTIKVGGISGAGGQEIQLSYTPQGWLNQVERRKDDASWLTVQSTTYDSAGNRLTSTSYREGTPLTTTFVNDALGRVVRVTDPKQKPTQYRYDALGRQTVMVDAESRETHYAYDALSRLIKIEQDKTGVNAKTELSYDAVGNLVSVLDPESSTTTYVYDALSRRTKEIQPLGPPHAVETFYDDRDRVDYVVKARGHKIDYGYEPWGALKTVEYFPTVSATTPDRTVTLSHDYNGNVTGVTDTAVQPGVLYDFTYDELDRPDLVTANYLPGGPVTLDNGYDHYGNRNSLALNDGQLQSFTYGYNKLNQLNSIGFPGGQNPTVSYYEQLGLYKQIQFASGITTDYLYEDNGPTRQIKTQSSAQAILTKLDYTYDDVLNVENQTITNATGANQHSYGYDSLDHLTNAGHPDPQVDEAFEYDTVGNREDPNNAALYDYNANHQIVTGPGNVTYQFDNDGNLTSKSSGTITETFTHNEDSRLTQYSNDSVVGTYQYDPFGRRISKTVNGTKTYFLWDAASLMGEYNNAGSRTKRYHYLPYNLTPVQIEDQGMIYDVHHDHLQTPKLLTASDGSVVWSQTQEAFGKMTPTGSAVFNLRFPGQYFDQESGLHYNYFRDYDPTTGRYIQSDPIGLAGGLNLYLYGFANPVIFVDPNGLIVCRLLGLIPEGSEIKVGAGIGELLGASFEYTLASSGMGVSVQAGIGGGASAYATYGGTSRVGGGGTGIGNTGIHAGSYVGASGGAIVGGSTSVSFGTDGVSASTGVGFGLGGFGIASGFYVGRDFWECEEEDECED